MTRYLLAIAIGITTNVAVGDEFSISQFGINSKGIMSNGITLDGTGIQIGQAEVASLDIDDGGRSGKAGYDDVNHYAANTFPAGVYNQNDSGQALQNFHVSEHATWVAGVMVGKPMPAKYEGVAPNAQLSSIAIDDNMADD